MANPNKNKNQNQNQNQSQKENQKQNQKDNQKQNQNQKDNQKQNQNQGQNQKDKQNQNQKQSQSPGENQKDNQNQNQNQNPKQSQSQNRNQNENQRRSMLEDFSLKETTPNIGAGRVISSDWLPTAFDLVEQMHFLYVRVVRARELSGGGKTDACNPYVEIKLGNHKGTTKVLEKASNPEWQQVFAFGKERIQDSLLEIVVKDKLVKTDDILGRIVFSISDIPKRVPPDSPLAPQWYSLEDKNGAKIKGELMLSIWMGTQADEAFVDASHSDAPAVTDAIANTRSKIYLSPKLWYLRVNVIQAQDLLLKEKTGNSEVSILAVLGHLGLRSTSRRSDANPLWNEDLMFVAAEPFDEQLVLSLEQGHSNKHEVLGRCVIPLKTVEKRLDAAPPSSKWYNLEKPAPPADGKSEERISSKINLRISLDGGYHVLDEATNCSSDLRPSAKKLCKPGIGVLEIGILSATGLFATKKDNRMDAYCVAKYGPKWVRTRTIVDSRSPKWNEQYTWEVYDPCTVITIVVFDNGHLSQGGDKAEDKRIGKVRIRLSTLESDRIYTHSYPLISLQPSGAKKMGEIQLAMRFSCPSLLNMLQTYGKPLLPRMHYLSPLSIFQLDSLRNQAAVVTSMRLSRAEPPLRREVVDYVLDVRANVWSMRRGRATFHRILGLLEGFVTLCKAFDYIRSWKNSIITVVAYLFFVVIVLVPELVLPTVFYSFLLVGVWRYRTRPRHPSHMDIKLSQADTATNEELDEEFEPFPSKVGGDNLRKRYDRLRAIAGRGLAVMSDLATQGERVQSLLSWRDPRATALFVIFCFIAGMITYAIPFRFTVIISLTYLLRPPRFRSDMPAIPQNFLRRMPAKLDSLL